MFTKLSLRLRVFLFFALLALGTVAIISGSLFFAASRMDPANPMAALSTGGIMAAFLAALLVAGIWYLFDENVARAIERLSADLRARAHTAVDRDLDDEAGKYLGDLAPAAGEIAKTLTTARSDLEVTVAEQTARLQEQTSQLTALLSDVQMGLILCSPSHQIVFYNPTSVDLLQDTGRPRLDRSIFDLLRERPIQRTYNALLKAEDGEQHRDVLVSTVGCGRTIAAHMRLVSGALGIGEQPGYVLTLRDVSDDMKLHTERERLLSETVEAIRIPAARLQAVLDMHEVTETPDPKVFVESMKGEAAALIDVVNDLAARHDANQDTWWPMQEVRASHLIDAIRGHLGPDALPFDAPSPYIVLRCDGFALASLLNSVIDKITELDLAKALSLSVDLEGSGALLTLHWDGAPMPVTALRSVLDEPLEDAPFSITGQEILEHHNSDMWPETTEDGQCALVLPIAEAREASRTLTTKAGFSRPTVFDFDLLSQVRDGSIAGKKLSDLTYVVFDTETTGLDPKGGDEIVQIAAVRMLNGKRVDGEVLDQLVDPERNIPAKSTEIHGISEDMVKGKPTIREAGAQFHRFSKNAVLVAHNAPFDMAFFHRHADTIGVSFDHPVLDTVLLSAILFGQNEEHTLDALADRFGVIIPEEVRHTAIGDTIATAEVFQHMLPMLEAHGLDTYDAVMEAMEKNSRLLREMKARVG